MQLGMIGLGRMGANMARRLLRRGHQAVVHDPSRPAVEALAGEGATGAGSVAELVARLARPRAVWLMVPAATVERAVEELMPHLEAGDAIVDGGNSHFVDDVRRARAAAERGLAYLDVGTSGGVWGLERGYCLMIGGEDPWVSRLDPIFSSLAPGEAFAPPTPGREGRPGTAARGYLHCGPSGAGHFVKMVHNGIEYGMMAAYAEGLNVLRHADAGAVERAADAETSPLREPERYRYRFALEDVAEVWRRGSVVSSWLLDLTAQALLADPGLSGYEGRVSDSGEGRWTQHAAIDEGVPTPVLSAALHARFASQGQGDFASKVLSAMRQAFGGHLEKPRGSGG